MDSSLHLSAADYSAADVNYFPAFNKKVKEENSVVLTGVPKELTAHVKTLKAFSNFKASKSEVFEFDGPSGERFGFVGCGEKSKFKDEDFRKVFATLIKSNLKKSKSISLGIDSLATKASAEKFLKNATEIISMASYEFTEFKTEKSKPVLTDVSFFSKEKATVRKKWEAAMERGFSVGESVNICRDLVNTPPNVLNSVTYAKRVEQDVKKNLKGVKVNILGKAEIKKEKMGCFLSVNAGSAYDPKLVHLTYTPKKVTKNTKHVALVGKGLTFDTGGYSLKPSTAMVNMKFDMAGSSTVYAAFRAAVLLGANVKISCYLGLTDNAVSSEATMPDSIVTARNGKTVEILNTDAEGRLVLADVLSYASDHKPDYMINAATLTGACLVALGHEVCGIMGNNQKFIDTLLKTAGNSDERMWQLPIFDEFREDMKSPIADLKNMGGSRFAGTAKAAAFLENFVGEGIAWSHLDIAGIGDGQGHLSYCPKKGGSGLVVRTLTNFLTNLK
ncbi:MAG: leucyl aminopeptidase [Bacteriovoracaceae bacterium]